MVIQNHFPCMANGESVNEWCHRENWENRGRTFDRSMQKWLL